MKFKNLIASLTLTALTSSTGAALAASGVDENLPAYQRSVAYRAIFHR